MVYYFSGTILLKKIVPICFHGLGLVLAVFVLLECGGKKNSESTNGERTISLTHGLRVVAAPIIASIDGTGIVQGDEETVVISKTSGTIIRVLFDIGDKVRIGDTLVSVENDVSWRALQQAEIELTNAKKVLHVNQSLLSAGAISEIDVQSSQAEYYGALAQHKMMLEQYNDSTIKSPIDGYIVDKNKGISSGSVIGNGVVVGRISKRDLIKIQVAIADVYVSLIAQGGKVQVRIPAIGDKKYSARISRISSAADTVTGTVPVTVLLDAMSYSTQDDAQSQFRTGLIASVELFTTNSPVYPIIPRVAIHDEVLNERKKQFVYIVQDAGSAANVTDTESEENVVFKVSKRVIQTGKEFVGNVEVLSGISEDEVKNTIVLISSTEQLFDGAEVLVKIIGATTTF